MQSTPTTGSSDKAALSTAGRSLQDINMLWIGDALSPIERLSIRSYLAAGHAVNLFTFGPVEGVPAGTTMASAHEFMTDTEYGELRNRKSGSYSLAANLFRYRLLRTDAGLWSDSDFVCLRPIDLRQDNIFGWESASHINNGFLYLRPDSPVLKELLEYFQNGMIPPWLTPSRRRKLWFRKHIRRLPIKPADMPRGTLGPRALTWLATQHGVAQDAQPIERFYAHGLADAERIFDSHYRPAALESSDTLLIHLWNERIADMKDRIPEPGSMLADFYTRFNAAE